MDATVETLGPGAMLRESAVKEAVWGCATYFFELTHAGAGAVVEWTYRAVQAVLDTQPVEVGSGYDLTVDVLPTPVRSLSFAFRVCELSEGSKLLPRGGLVLDVTYVAATDDGGPWHDYRSRIAASDPEDILDHVAVLPPGTPLTALTGVDRASTRWALRVALDRAGHLEALGMRRGDAPS
ncbi:hypothetical protein [Actinoplanes sp. NPDC089786]|uniref:hypothetical protein n=1 Tax=Actinoplanes sp. NPDC089786 TaxID=3155185 RepID=UPI003448746D